MDNSRSIAEARDRLPRLVHEAEWGMLIELTRRARRCGFSLKDHERMRGGTSLSWQTLQDFRSV